MKIVLILIGLVVWLFLLLLALSLGRISKKSDRDYYDYLKSQGWDDAYLKSQGLCDFGDIDDGVES